MHYVTAENQWYLLTAFEDVPGTFIEWIIRANRTRFVEFLVTQLECNRCSQALDVSI